MTYSKASPYGKTLDDILPMFERTYDVLKNISPIYSFKSITSE